MAVGMALPACDVSVAVKVTDWPVTELLGDAVTVVEVVSCWASKAPMSTPFPARGKPRWS